MSLDLPDPDAASSLNLPDPDQPAAQAPQKTPGFLKTIDMIASGVDRGVKNFTLSLMAKQSKQWGELVPGAERYNEAYLQKIKDADAGATAVQEQNKKDYPDSWAPYIGEGAGELLPTAAVGGLFGGAIKAGKAVQKVAPYFTKTIAGFGTTGAATVGANALVESQRFDPENPGQLINKEAVSNALSPLGATLGALSGGAGLKLSNYMDNVAALQKAKEFDKYATARSLRDPNSPSRKFEDQVYGLLPAMTQWGHSIKQRRNIGDAMESWIRKTSAAPSLVDATPEQIFNYAGKKVKGTLKEMQHKASLAWEKGFKERILPDNDEVIKEVNDALSIIRETQKSIPEAGLTVDELERGIKQYLPKSKIQPGSKMVDQYGNPMEGSADTALQIPSKHKFKVNDVKNLNTLLGDTIHNLKEKGTTSGYNISKQLTQIQDNLTNVMRKNLSGEDFKDFTSAQTESSMVFKMKGLSKQVEEAFFEETAANNVVRKLVGTPAGYDEVKPVFGQMTDPSKKAVVIAQVSEAFKKHKKPGGFDLKPFIDEMKSGNFPDAFRETDTFKAMEGLLPYLTSVQETSKIGFFKQAAVLATVGAASGIGGMLSGASAAVPIVSYAATMAIANHSPLKKILGVIPKKLSPSVYESLTKAASKHLARIGVSVSNGVLRHKYNKDIPEQEDEENNDE